MRKLFYLLFLFFPVAGFAQCTASDPFTTTANPLNPANWAMTTIPGGANLEASGGTAFPVSATLGEAYWIGSSCTPPPDQSSTITITTGLSTGNTGPAVRVNSDGTGYFWSSAGGTTAVYVQNISSGHLTGYQVLEYCPSMNVTSGDTFTLTIRGTHIYGYHNGALVCQGGNGDITTGAPGIWVDRTSAADSVGAWSSSTADLLAPTLGYGTGSYAFSPVLTFTTVNSNPVPVICYTTDGSTPTATTGTCTHGTQVALGSTLTVSTTTTVNAIASAPGITANSPMTTAVITIVSPATYYVRHDGGTRISTNMTFGQCDGMTNTSYVAASGALTNATWQPATVYAPGAVIGTLVGTYYSTSAGLTSGGTIPTFGASSVSDNGGTWTQGAAYPINQHCAFSDYRYFFQDGSFTSGTTFPSWGWVGAGGDTYIDEDSIANGQSNAIGPDTNQSAIGGGSYCQTGPCWGVAGQSRISPPQPNSGGPSNHTQLFGGNYAACSAQTARTQLHGQWGINVVQPLYATQYLDMKCFDITDWTSCTNFGSGYPGCKISGQINLNFANDGIEFAPDSHDITVDNLRLHGLAGAGIIGATGGNVVLTHIDIVGNADAGWNMDDGTGLNGFGSLLLQNFSVIASGCSEEFPVVDPLPYEFCTDDQNGGGYGDGIGTATVASPPPGWQIHFDQGVVAYQTQDGLDTLHIGGTGSSVTDTRILAYGNMGNQLKIGGTPTIPTVQNSAIVGNCFAMQNNIPGFPIGFNAQISDFCRAGGASIAISVSPATTTTIQGNTFFGNDAGLIVEADYTQSSDEGPSNVMVYNDNVNIGFNVGGFPGAYGGAAGVAPTGNPGGSFTNNSYLNITTSCPQAGETLALCNNTTTNLTNMAYSAYTFGNMAPLSSSSLLGAGVFISSIPVDILGATRPNPPAIGAYELGGAAPAVPVTFTGTLNVGSVAIK